MSREGVLKVGRRWAEGGSKVGRPHPVTSRPILPKKPPPLKLTTPLLVIPLIPEEGSSWRLDTAHRLSIPFGLRSTTQSQSVRTLVLYFI